MVKAPKTVVGAIESRDDGISFMMRRDEAAALITVAETGLSVTQALRLITHTATAEHALSDLRDARGRSEVTLALSRPQGAALAAIATTGLAVTRSVKTLADLADVAAAERALNALHGAMR